MVRDDEVAVLGMRVPVLCGVRETEVDFEVLGRETLGPSRGAIRVPCLVVVLLLSLVVRDRLLVPLCDVKPRRSAIMLDFLLLFGW